MRSRPCSRRPTSRRPPQRHRRRLRGGRGFPAGSRRGGPARWPPLVLVAAAVAAGLTLRRGAAGGVSGPRVVAVLPFKNLGPPGDQYFADGLTEEITSRLAGLSGLRVISRTSADQYRSSTQSVRAIGAELGADYVLEGSVRWARDRGGVGRLRVTPQLIRVRDDSHLWAATYEAALGEVFRLQSEIAERVTVALDVALRAPERAALAATGTQNSEAYDFYLKGMNYLARTNQAFDLRSAAQLFEQAVAGRSLVRPGAMPGSAGCTPRSTGITTTGPTPGSSWPSRRPRPRSRSPPTRPRPTWRSASIATGASWTTRARSASSSSPAGSSRATASCSRRSATSSAARAAGRSRSPGSWRRCATIHDPASATSTRATTTSRSISTPRPSTTSSGPACSRPTGAIRTSTWRPCT